MNSDNPAPESFEYREDGCPFCRTRERTVEENELALTIKSKPAVVEGHLLIIPRRHVEDYFDLHQSERNAIDELMRSRREALLSSDKKIEGFNIVVNVGAAAGQSVFHVHVHLIPRRRGDVSDPLEGVHGIIPEKTDY